MTAAISLRNALHAWAVDAPEAPALKRLGGTWLSRAALERRLEQGRARLRGAGLGPAGRVALWMPQGLDAAICALQLAAACSLAPLRPGPGRRWTELLERLAADALVIDPQAEPELAALAAARGIPLLHPALLLAEPSDDPTTDLAPTDHAPTDRAPTDRAADGASLAGGVSTNGDAVLPSGTPPASGLQTLLVSTSGTAGLPRWVLHSQEAVLRGCQAMASALQLQPEDRTLLALPLHHTHGLVSGLLMPLISGGSVVVAESLDPAALLHGLAAEQISWISLPPAMHHALLEARTRQQQPPPLPRLRFLRSGAISMPPALLEALRSAFQVPVLEAYGMSECPHISTNRPQAPRAGWVGRPVVPQLAIVDAEGEPVAAGTWGQVAVQGAPVMLGYLGDAPATAAALRDGWLLTGDQGRLDAAGCLQLRGRLNEQINRGGLKLMPAVVDDALLSHPAVAEALAFALPHGSLGEDLAAAVVLRPGAVADEQELRRHAFRLLAPHEVPSRIVLVPALPRGATGKPQRIGLAARLEAVLQPPQQAPVGELEQLVAQGFAAVLQQPAPGRHANFFQLGGDSLSGQRLVQLLSQQLALELSPTLVFACPSVRELAERLDRLLDQALEALG